MTTAGATTMAGQTGSRTLFDRVWDSHAVGRRMDGRALVYMDRHVIHDLHAPHAFRMLEAAGRPVRRPDLTVAVTDHMVSTAAARGRGTNPDAVPFLEQVEAGAARHGIRLFGLDDPAQGIVHVVAPELGIALPGATLACPDSHVCTVGALGTVGFATGTTEVAHVLATQVLATRKPKQMRVVLDGALRPGVTAKDVILFLIGRLGSDAAKGHAVEYAGAVVTAMSVEARMTLCNMTTELGGRTAVVAPDEAVAVWLHARRYAPAGPDWEGAARSWAALRSDDGARFDKDLTVDCTGLEPQVTWGIDPSHVVAVGGRVPLDAAPRAVEYMGVQPGTPMADLLVDRVFIGSCTNGRISDLRAAARVVAGRRVAPGVQAAIVPGSSAVRREAEAEGLDRVFLDAGFEWRQSGCSMCAGLNGENGLPGERVVSTTNRNFAGRQGAGVRTHLASPETAAAAAVTGRFTDPRTLVQVGVQAGAPA